MARTRWEYTSAVYAAGSDATAELMVLGRDGWELVAVREGCPPDVDRYYLKREASGKEK